MAMAKTLKQYLDAHGVKYEVIPHKPTSSSTYTAEAAHVSGNQLAKGVVLKDDKGYLLAVLPASYHLDLEQLNKWLGRELEMVPEEELSDLFADCEPGAVPPVGSAYGLETVLEEDLARQSDIYFEAGTHREVIHVDAEQFSYIEGRARRGRFSHRI
jgi:Uncharacterized conserved protein